ncbi:MAG: hypothetical protein QOK40_837, partial [Miltoncostaeaceae bacterium]|nr:hypothetical protein [Miltoncostaeaceae bacterium]
MLGLNRWAVVAASAGMLAGSVSLAASARAEGVLPAGDAGGAVAASDGSKGATRRGNDSGAAK